MRAVRLFISSASVAHASSAGAPVFYVVDFVGCGQYIQAGLAMPAPGDASSLCGHHWAATGNPVDSGTPPVPEERCHGLAFDDGGSTNRVQRLHFV
jgi:hypothetical protein